MNGDPSMPIFAVTSMSPAMYDDYGGRMVASFVEHWPEGSTLFVYLDGGSANDPRVTIQREGDAAPRVEIVPTESCQGVSTFLAATQRFDLTRGVVSGQYDYRLDATFGRKAFVQYDAAARVSRRVRDTGARLFWIDADTTTHSPVTVDFLEGILPDDKLCCYLGREQIGMHSECGFIGWNLANPVALPALSIFRSLYDSGRFVSLPEWHDSYVFDVVIKSLIADESEPWASVTSDSFVDIGAGVPLDPEHIHVFVNSTLGSVMDHFKGPRKKWGASPATDLVAERPEAYWRGEGS